MADRMTPEQRSRCMSAVKGKDTKPELIVRKYLFSKGLRYRLHVRSLPGNPDIVLPKYVNVPNSATDFFSPDRIRAERLQEKIILSGF